jgi:hypothetical protein
LHKLPYLCTKEKKMNWSTYFSYFESIVKGESKPEPYNDADFFNYTKLNLTRTKRWLKKGELNPELKDRIEQISEKQNWVLITEPWCGDAAHSVPFIYLLSELNPNITLNIQLRDTDSEIDNYLTDGNKSIPILIIRDEKGEDLAVWNSRPKKCQEYFLNMKREEMPIVEIKTRIQEWYNHDAGFEIQNEILEIVTQICVSKVA